MNIIQALDEPRFFKGLFKDLSTWASWRTFSKAFFGIKITDKKERRLVKKCTGRKPPSKQVREAFLAIARRAGKSFFAAILGVFQS